MKVSIQFVFIVSTVNCLFCMACTNSKKSKVKILHASTLFSRGNYLELYNDSTYTVNCYLSNVTEGKFSMKGDTIFLEHSKDRCDLKNGKLLLSYNDSIAKSLSKSKSFIQKTNDSLPQGYLFELNSNNVIQDNFYVYHILMDSTKIK